VTRHEDPRHNCQHSAICEGGTSRSEDLDLQEQNCVADQVVNIAFRLNLSDANRRGMRNGIALAKFLNVYLVHVTGDDLAELQTSITSRSDI
jgi:hypothetical protein